jgi:hypothetical protein
MPKAKKKSAPKKTVVPKSRKKSLPAKKATAKSEADGLAEQALKFVDEAAALLRSGIREGAKTTSQSRAAAKKKAHSLLGKASTSLSQALEEGTSVLQNLLKKL